MRSKRSFFSILILVLIIPTIVHSAIVSHTTAEQVAMNWYSERNDKAPNDFSIVESFVETENAENIYYIFNFDKTGFVIVAADDITIPILGYVFQHNYSLENHPPQFDAMLASFREQILYARNNDLSPPRETTGKWDRLKVASEEFVPEATRAVAPLLSTTWDQGAGWNSDCPPDASGPGGYCYAGCTATATAQVMKYHAHPATGEGLHSYTPAGYSTQTVNFAAATYTWGNMFNATPTNDTRQLLYHVGVGAEMQYGAASSGAWIGDYVPPTVPASALSAMQDYFKYDLNSYYDQKINHTTSAWHSKLKTELDSNRPLVYEGYGPVGGHAFVLDGYQGASNDHYHFNWGWSGAYDGYFYLTSLVPSPPSYDFTADQAGLFGVEPRKWRPLPDESIDISLMDYTGVDLDNYYEGPTPVTYSVVTNLLSEEFALNIDAVTNELVFSENPTVTSNVNIDITIRASYSGGTSDDTFNFIITGLTSTIDWGDAPDPAYPTLSGSMGANHTIVAGLQLGNLIDPEPNGQPDATATGDDLDGTNDDDGINLPTSLIPGSIANYTASVSTMCLLNAWIDFDGNGSWAEPGEQIETNRVLTAGSNPLSFTVPASASTGTTFARFRVNSLGNLSFTGPANDGEVEDYQVDITTQGSSLKWEQLPDLSPTGMDVDATFKPNDPPPILLADDFHCNETGYITDIHIWGSWMYDHIPFFEDPAAVQIKFSIHTDIPDPDGPGPEYSMPGDLLWERTWIPGPDDVEMVYDGPEDWYNPFFPLWLDDNHFSCYKYNYILDPADYFLQEGTIDEPIVYWLDVQALPMDEDPECRFGWKTSLDHWNDDAVWIDAEEQYMGPWNELRYPFGHEFEGESIDLAFQITTEEGPTDEYDFGDAPEGDNKLAYPSGVIGSFPTCKTVGPAGYIQHGSGENFAWFGPMVDLETDGNAGFCPGCFPTYDDDECFQDGDAGLIIPDSYTIDATGSVVTCPTSTGSSLGIICNNAVWGTDIDIDVNNMSNADYLVNVLVDWNQNGQWQNDVNTHCAGIMTPEHVLVDFVVPAGHMGPISNIMAIGSSFQIGPNIDYVWVRFSITEAPVGNDWDGSGVFEDGETEDYLLYIEDEEPEELDFGDALENGTSFPTTLANNGARHTIVPNYCLGLLIDSEPDGQPDPAAMGDDNDTIYPQPPPNDDEDGIQILTNFVPGQMAIIDISTTKVAGDSAFLDGWADYNNDGDWDDAGEQIFTSFALAGWPINFNSVFVPVPASAVAGATVFCRFRMSRTGGLAYSGACNEGEVEDYHVLIVEPPDLDFGDAPDPTYPTLLALGGANHVLDGLTWLGALIDAEPDGLPDANAMGDDNNGVDDEDGIIFQPIMTGSPAQIEVTTSAAGYLQGWMDFNNDGDWNDVGEQIFVDTYIHSAGTVCLNYYVPANAVTGFTFARFRFSTIGGIGVAGMAPDGEVEDYHVDIFEYYDVKWSQLPCEHLPGLHCHDYIDPAADITIADDWLCNGGLVTDIHWWGNYEFVNSGISHFHLSIHANDPATCLPLEPELWGIDVPLAQTNETPTGLFSSDGNMIYSYDYDLIDPFPQVEGTQYWLDISAHSVDPSNYVVWNWQESSRSVAPILCPASDRTTSTTWLWIDWLTPAPTRYSDMAFEITSCRPSAPINFTITKVGTNMTLQWDPDPCSIYYNVYSSTDPYATFPGGWTLEATGTKITTTTWSDPVSTAGVKKFYRVTAEN